MLEFESEDQLLRPGNSIEFLAILQLRKDENDQDDVVDPIPVLMYGRIIAIEYERNTTLDQDTPNSGAQPWEMKRFGFTPRALRVESAGGAAVKARRWTLMYDSSWGGWTAVMNDHVVFGSRDSVSASSDAYSLLIAKQSKRTTFPTATDKQSALDRLKDELGGEMFGEFVDFEDVEDGEDEDEDETPRFE
jgi:hypothetical protein